MKCKYLLIAFLLGTCASANAEWFLRGTHNAWAASQMESAGTGTNTVQLKNVVFSAAGGIKFDRFGDWKESYGINGNNIPVAAGTWDIKFFTDTKNWSISASPGSIKYHIRGTFNAWAEGTLLTQVASSDVFERCVNFVGGDANGGPRFKIDPNGGWGDSLPAGDFLVNAGWVKVSFNSTTKAIAVQQNLPANCATSSVSSSVASSSSSSIASSSSVGSSVTSSSVSSSSKATVYHLRGTNNGWTEGTLMTRMGTLNRYQVCVRLVNGDANGGPRFRIDPNGGWGNDALPKDGDFKILMPGWALITLDAASGDIFTQQGMSENCGGSSSSSTSSINSSSASSKSSVASSVVSSSKSSASSVTSSSKSSVSSSSAGATVYHLRGTINGWAEGTLMKQIGTTNVYEQCANFVSGDDHGGPRFKIDPNGAWGDDIPSSDFNVSVGWVKITFNSTTKVITTQQNLTENCGAQVFHLRGTQNGWAEGDLFESVDGIQPVWSICRNFGPADAADKPRFKIDPNGGWGADSFPAADVPTSGWTSIVIDGTRIISQTKDMAPNCAAQ